MKYLFIYGMLNITTCWLYLVIHDPAHLRYSYASPIWPDRCFPKRHEKGFWSGLSRSTPVRSKLDLFICIGQKFIATRESGESHPARQCFSHNTRWRLYATARAVVFGLQRPSRWIAAERVKNTRYGWTSPSNVDANQICDAWRAG